MEENKNLNEELNTKETEEEKAEKEAEQTVSVDDGREKTLEEQVTPELKEEIKKDDISGTYTGTARNLDNAYFNPIHYVHDGTISIDDDMEKRRTAFAKKLSKTKVLDIISIIVMIISFVAVILVVFLNKGENRIDWLTWVVGGVAAVIIIGTFILSSFTNKKNTKATKEYLNEYEDMLNGYVISNLNIDNPTLCIDAKVNDQDIIQAHYFHTINRIESRAVVEGKRNGRRFSLGEVAVVIPTISIDNANKKPEDMINLDGTVYIPEPINNTMTGTQEIASKDMTVVDLDLSNEVMDDKEAKKREKDEKKAANRQTDTATGLFGKIYSYDMAVDSEEAFIISFMGVRSATVLPDNLTGFKAVKIPSLRNNIVVYCTDVELAKKFFDEKGCELLNSINPNQVVQSMFISCNSYGSKIGMNLADDIMQLPIKQLKHLGSYESYKDFTDKAFAFVDYVASKAGK